MTLAGDDRAYTFYLKMVHEAIEMLGESLPDALLRAPEEYRSRISAEIADRIDRQKLEVRFFRAGTVLQQGGPRPWFGSWNTADGYLWRRLRSYLLVQKGWSAKDVDLLDDSSDRVMQYLEDPRPDSQFVQNEFRTQGLVLGYVQSGKTANFTALIAKSVDAGYKLVIVLSGIHNSLRAQTQRRLDLELGLVDDPKGVGTPSDTDQVWWPITTSDLSGDFNPGTVRAAPIQQGMRSIMVVKKNATVLRRLVRWLDGIVPADLPVLVIDDEADQASINTKATLEDVDLTPNDQGEYPEDKELDPSIINGLIRDLLSRFSKVAFVAYTATPFANVLIDPDAASLTLGGDLFPRDFIYSLPRPSRYIGAERIFGRAALDREGEPVDGLDVIRIVPDEEVALLVPRGRHLDDWVPEVTPSLNAAILDWVLATAAKEERLGPGISSMLIHTTMRVAIQDALAEAIGERLVELRREWRYETAGLRAQLYYRWNRQFRPTTASLDLALDRTFEQIEPQVNAVLLGLDDETLLVLNNRSKQQLNYEDDSAQKIVLIGGNRLSRGLTIEYLTVSFFVRESNNYDTLLQMGRWFGYRSDYVDLTRLWTTRELVSRFEHLALVEEELRDDIAIYQRERLTPLEVAPKIRSHPVMTVTADNKMGSGRTFQQSYSGQRIQTTRFRLGDDSWLGDNVDSSRQLLGALGQPTGSARGQTDRPCWVDIPWTYVVGFLENFRSLQRAQSFDSATASQYVRTQAEMHGELISWTVSVRSGAEPDAELGSWDLGITGWGGVAAISRSRKKADPESIGVLTNPPRQDNLAAGDEAADLTDAQLIRAARQLSDYPTPGHAIRAQRDKTSGLILLYPISPFSTPKKNSQDRLPLFDEPEGRPLVVGVALSFPYSSSPATVEYVVGRPSHAYADDDE